MGRGLTPDPAHSLVAAAHVLASVCTRGGGGGRPPPQAGMQPGGWTCVFPAAQALSGCGHRGAHMCCSRVSGGREGGSHGLPRSPEALARPKDQPQKARMLSRLVGARGSRGDRAPEPWECFHSKSTCFRNPGSGGVHPLCCKHLPSRHLPCAALGMLDSEAPVPSAQGERGSRGRPARRREQLT